MSYWWSTVSNPDITRAAHRNARFLLEKQAFQRLFPKGREVLLQANPASNWNKDCHIHTIDLGLNADDYDQLYWLAIFYMTPAGHRPKKWESDTVFGVKIVHLPGYPYQEPVAYPYIYGGRSRSQTLTIARDWIDFRHINADMDHHMFTGGYLCLWQHSGPESRGWDPSENTAATFAQWSIEWIRAFLFSRKSGYFPDST